LTTRSTAEGDHAVIEEDFVSEDSDSVHSFNLHHEDRRKKHIYISTNLVTGTNLTLADVISEEVTA